MAGRYTPEQEKRRWNGEKVFFSQPVLVMLFLGSEAEGFCRNQFKTF
jgi:hypothetical protein